MSAVGGELVVILAFGEKVAAEIAEFAPGIPSREVSHELPRVATPSRWEFGVHRHEATRRGEHYDLRLGDPETGRSHSWAMPPRWPKPGESTWVIQQPTHTVEYMDWEGTIPEGTYGAGKVSLHDRTPAEVVRAEPGHAAFNVYKTTGPEEYVLHRIQDRTWRLTNRTPTRASLSNLPSDKPKYRSTSVARDDVEPFLKDGDWLASAKIDDAHNLFVLPSSGDPVRVVSYRIPKRGQTGVIEHTHKVPDLLGAEVPAGLGGTVLRGGLWAIDPKTGEAAQAKDLASLLNTSVWKSRDKQSSLGKLTATVYDVARYRGRDVSAAPYEDKLRILREVSDKIPALRLPDMAESEDDKRALVDRIIRGEHPQTKEGVVFWNMKKSVPAVKAKLFDDHDVYVRGFFSGEGKYSGRGVGGFTYSHEEGGPVVGRVGTGLSDAMRKDMHRNPKKYLGLVATVSAQERFSSGALRAPAWKAWHVDKNSIDDLEDVKT